MTAQLQKFLARSLTFRATITAAPDTVKAVCAALDLGPKKPLMLQENYDEGGELNESFILMGTGETEDKLFFLALYTRGKTGERAAQDASEGKLWSTLASIGEEQNLLSEAVFVYPSSDYVSIFGFPVRVPAASPYLFDEMRGFRVVKLNEGRKVYDLTAEEPEDEPLINTVRFSYVGRLTNELPNSVLEAANQISSKFIARLEKKS